MKCCRPRITSDGKMKNTWLFVLSLILLTGMIPVVAADQKRSLRYLLPLRWKGRSLSWGRWRRLRRSQTSGRKLSRINLGRAPRFGETASLYRTNVLYILDRSGLAGTYTLEMPAKVTVTRASQLVTPEQILAAVEAYIGEQASSYWTSWRVEPGRLQERRVPQGELDVQVGRRANTSQTWFEHFSFGAYG